MTYPEGKPEVFVGTTTPDRARHLALGAMLGRPSFSTDHPETISDLTQMYERGVLLGINDKWYEIESVINAEPTATFYLKERLAFPVERVER